MNRRFPALAVAAAAITLTSAVAALRVPAASTALARRAEPTATAPSVTTKSGCRVETARDVDGVRVGVSETVGVTLTLYGCVPRAFPIHVALVLDMDARSEVASDVRRMVDEMLEGLDLPNNPLHRVTVASFGPRAQLLVLLSNVEGRVRGALSRAERAPSGEFARGVNYAMVALKRGRAEYAPSDAIGIREVMIIVTPGWSERAECAEASAAVGMAKSQGILVIAVATQDDGNPVGCVRSLATTPRYFFSRQDVTLVGRIFLAIRKQFQNSFSGLVNLVITDTVAPAFDLEPATVNPPASATSPDGRTLRWQLPATITHPAAAITVTYRLRPTALGLWPVSLGASAAFTDARAARGTVAFPPASVEVIDAATADARVCPATHAAVPADVIAAALAHPERVSGWGLRCSTSQPPGPSNPLRQSLRLARPGMAYHPVANGVVWGCGC